MNKKILSVDKKKKEKALFIILSAMIVILVVLIWTNDRGLARYIQNRKEYERLSEEVEKLEEENELLKKEITLMEKDQYFFEKVAREDLNMIKDGEVIIKLDQGETEPDTIREKGEKESAE